ncbi:nuclear transport factor 2 family protein [uncultured Brevundimonas sp.]|uniref:nuclear transport factor 2 family protein n=1 Tax=uncultured Brevundimonas sp. TaxID=213418 RepID=UPI002632B960|nr:nuclear transport factor 2 family protein [uncultured Brevundimonas sp.]
MTASPRRLAGICLTTSLALAVLTMSPSVATAEKAQSVASFQPVAVACAPTEANRRLVTAAFDRWARGQGDFFDTVLSPNVVWTIEGSGPSAGTFRGRDVLVAKVVTPFSARLMSQLRPVSHRVWADGDHVVINWVGEAVAGDGRPYRNTYAWILRLHEGRAVEVNAFLDLEAYDDILRRVPPPEPASDGRP